MRLIDADELKVYLQEYLHYEHAIPWVDAQPTAYDVEKVVEELENKKNEYLEGFRIHDNDEMYGVACGFGDSIEIVRKGGVK